MHLSINKLVRYIKIKCLIIYNGFINFIVNLIRSILFSHADNPQKILIFRTGSIGDSICAMPAISNIRNNFPHSTIHLLTNSGKSNISLVSIERLINPEIFDRVINYEKLNRKDLITTIKAEEYDLVIQLPQYGSYLSSLLRDMFFFRFIGIRSGFGWEYARNHFLKKIQEKYGININERDRLNHILLKNKLQINNTNQYLFFISENDKRSVESHWEIMAFNLQKHVIGIVIGAKRPQNRWPISNFEYVVNYCSRFYNIILLGGPEDVELASSLTKFPNTYSCCGLLTPIQSGLMMKKCQLVLSNDTGPMHLAYSFGTKVIALFSCRDYPGRWYPPMNENNFVFRSENIKCSICLSETCSDNICMKNIIPIEVVNKIEEML